MSDASQAPRSRQVVTRETPIAWRMLPQVRLSAQSEMTGDAAIRQIAVREAILADCVAAVRASTSGPCHARHSRGATPSGHAAGYP